MSHGRAVRRRVIHVAGTAALALAGCAIDAGAPVVKDAARPHAQQILADAPNLLPEQPVTSVTTSRGQQGDLTPVGGAGARVAARVRAKVNDTPILEEEVREAVAQYAGELMSAPESQRGELLQKITERELQRLIERELVLEDMFSVLKQRKLESTLKQLKEMGAKEADRRLREIKQALKVATDEEMKAILQQQGLTVDGIRRQVERNAIMMDYIRNLIFASVSKISLQQVREYFEENPAEFSVTDRVRWQDIFIDASRFPDATAARRYAEQVLARVRAGEDFAALAREFDHGDSKLRNGDGIGTKRGEIKPAEAESVVWNVRPGEAGPLIDLGFGLHIIKVVERDYAGRRPFDAACQDEVRRKIQGRMAEREYKRIVDDLKKKASIQVFQ